MCEDAQLHTSNAETSSQVFASVSADHPLKFSPMF